MIIQCPACRAAMPGPDGPVVATALLSRISHTEVRLTCPRCDRCYLITITELEPK